MPFPKADPRRSARPKRPAEAPGRRLWNRVVPPVFHEKNVHVLDCKEDNVSKCDFDRIFLKKSTNEHFSYKKPVVLSDILKIFPRCAHLSVMNL